MYNVHVIAVQHLNNSSQAKIYLWKCSFFEFRASRFATPKIRMYSFYAVSMCLYIFCFARNVRDCDCIAMECERIKKSGSREWNRPSVDFLHPFSHYKLVRLNKFSRLCVSQKRRETSQTNAQRERARWKKEKSAHMRNGIGKRFQL